MSEPTAAAMRAAEVCHLLGQGLYKQFNPEQIRVLATEIDNETGLPDLLEACTWATRSTHHPECLLGQGKSLKCNCHVAAARAAIAKAEGR